MEKAIEIKRRAQRCIQNGDLDGALIEYEKLVQVEDADPYHLVLLADLLFKRGDPSNAAQRYLAATTAYESAGLYKNAIAVCKKMMRLSLSPAQVLERLATLHGLDGLKTEAALYFMQYAEHLVRADKLEEATRVLRRSFETCPDEVRALERLAEVRALAGDTAGSAGALAEAALRYQQLGMRSDAERCRGRAEKLHPGIVDRVASGIMKTAAAGSLTDAGDREMVAAPGGENGTDPSDVAAADDHDLERTPGPPRLDAAMMAGPSSVAERPSSFTPPIPDPDHALEVDRSHGVARGEEPPGLLFDVSAKQDAAPDASPEAASAAAAGGVEELLASAQTRFREGDREGAAATLVEAAKAYEAMDRLDNAAAIYRSLCRGPQASSPMIELWLDNCLRRDDRQEAAEVACELGDRALHRGEVEAARGWFEGARSYDSGNAVAERRLARLAQLAAGGMATEGAAVEPETQVSEPADAGAPAAPPASRRSEARGPGRVEMAVGRGEAVTFDLGALLSEFQRGIEAQLSGDAQSHYDLAMTYREMGLLEQAVGSFRLAAEDPAFAHRSSEMIGRCLLDQGRFEEAAGEFASALEFPGLEAPAAVSLRYQLGLALEAAGHTQDALAEFERVFAAQASFPDVALKLRVLRKTLGND